MQSNGSQTNWWNSLECLVVQWIPIINPIKLSQCYHLVSNWVQCNIETSTQTQPNSVQWVQEYLWDPLDFSGIRISSEIQIADLLVGPFKDTELHRRPALFKSHGYNVKIFAKLTWVNSLAQPCWQLLVMSGNERNVQQNDRHFSCTKISTTPVATPVDLECKCWKGHWARRQQNYYQMTSNVKV